MPESVDNPAPVRTATRRPSSSLTSSGTSTPPEGRRSWYRRAGVDHRGARYRRWMDVTVKKLRYFAVVAEERHFTRAAARLFVAQQSLSRQIRDLEDEVGAQLFYRTTRSVELTPAGEVLLAGVQTALATLDAAIGEA